MKQLRGKGISAENIPAIALKGTTASYASNQASPAVTTPEAMQKKGKLPGYIYPSTGSSTNPVQLIIDQSTYHLSANWQKLSMTMLWSSTLSTVTACLLIPILGLARTGWHQSHYNHEPNTWIMEIIWRRLSLTDCGIKYPDITKHQWEITPMVKILPMGDIIG